MRRVVLFVAMSLDGYIADMNGSVDWLNGQCNEVENEDTYSQLVKNIDTVVMGWKTYYQVVTELSPSEWVYSNFISYVITHNERTSTDNIRYINEEHRFKVFRTGNTYEKKRIELHAGIFI